MKERDRRPVATVVIGYHNKTILYGTVSLDVSRQLFRQYDKFNRESFLTLDSSFQFSKVLLVMDKTSPQVQIKEGESILKKTKCPYPCICTDSVTRVCGDRRSMEWDISKEDLLVLKHYSSFEDFKEKISLYFRTKRFGLNTRNYLLRVV